MLKDPVARLAARAIFAGIGATSSSLITALPEISGGEGILAVLLGIGAALSLAGIEVGTPVNSQVGLNK